MWKVNGKNLTMTEGDFGLELPVAISGTTFAASDSVKIIVKATPNSEAIIEKTFSDIQDNTVKLVLSESESALLNVGTYVYTLDWYSDGVFMCNIIEQATFKVVDKA